MIKIIYKNNELESLFTLGKSAVYKVIVSKKMFMESLRCLKSILHIINKVEDLGTYAFLHYKHNSDYSSVTLAESGLCCEFVFQEDPQGNIITLYALNLK